MSAAYAARIRGACFAVGLVVAIAVAPAARADEPLPLATVVQRAIAYDAQVRAAQARVDALARQPVDVAGPAHGRTTTAFPTQRPSVPVAAPPDNDRAAIEAAERDLRRARDQVAARTAAAALDLQRQDRLVALAQRRLAEAERLAQRAAEPPRRGKAVPAVVREADNARRHAESALVDAQAARLSAIDRLESMAGHLVSGVAPFEWPATTLPDPAGDEAAARARAERFARQARTAREGVSRPTKTGAPQEDIAEALQAGDALHDLDLRAIDAAHELALARLNEQIRLGNWQQALADAPTATRVAAADASPAEPIAAAATPRQAVEPELEAAFRNWADAWRQKNLARYLASYANDFAPAGMSRDAWRAQRVARLSRPGPIELSIERAAWQRTDAETAEVRFAQRFRSPVYADASDKRLVWRHGPTGWRIVEEAARVEVSERAGRRKPG